MDARTLAVLQRITDAALSSLDEEHLLQELLQRVADIMRIDTVAILLLEGDHLHARAAKGIEEEVEQGVRIPVGGGFAGRIAAERRPITILDVDHADILNPILREKGIRSLLGVPLIAEGSVIGVLHVGSLTPRVFTEQDTALLQLAGDRAALAIEQARVYAQRRLTEALQRRLLPTGSHVGLRLEVASRYLPATGLGLGGDWYDAFPISEGRIVLVVGDVVGHGVEAAAVMGQLRTAVRAYAIEGHPPAEVAERVNTLMVTLGPGSITTLAYLMLDPAEGTLELVNAGHPPPLVIEPDGTARYIEHVSGIPLGAMPGRRYASVCVPLEEGSVVLLYTDGLVERRGESIDVGLEQLRAAATRANGDVHQLCSIVLDELVPANPADDIAFVAARLPPLDDTLELEWPARLEHLVDARNEMRRWLKRLTADAAVSYEVLVASQEACANAIEHSYGPDAATFGLRATIEDRRIRIIVTDRGRWRASRSEGRGRGLPLMRALMDDVEVRRSDHGTEVEMTRLIGGAP
jgi:anti-sigma regulatory factor (Ser/Thr protein kinase)/putative methionine-R-sulfoxide reductase with GAF domain